MTRDVVKRHPDVKAAAMRIIPLLDSARKAGIPVFFTRGGRHYHSVSFAPLTEAEKGIYAIKAAVHYKDNPLKAEDFEIADEAPAGRGCITRRRSSAFWDIHEPSQLAPNRYLIIAGMSSTGCLKEFGCFLLNYQVILPSASPRDRPTFVYYIGLRNG
jgi:nicotinamidase-related amidase